jgi:hypothetical protein
MATMNWLEEPKGPTGTLPVGQSTPPVTKAEQHISNSDPAANGGDPMHPGQEWGLDKRQTATAE